MAIKTRAQLVTAYGDAAFDMAQKGDALVRDVVDSTGRWTLLATWTFSTNVTEVVFTDLGDCGAIYLDFVGVTTGNVTLHMQFSADGGATYYSANGDYLSAGFNGAPVLATSMIIANATATARKLTTHTDRFNTASRKYTTYSTENHGGRLFDHAVALNALRVFPQSGNISAGVIHCWGRHL